MSEERPDPRLLVGLLQRYFLCRTDIVAFLAPWKKPCPGEVGDGLEALLLTHVQGASSPKAGLRYRNRRGQGAITGHFRLGAYAPAPDGTTKWLCLDFDGGEHADALVDPKATALQTWHRFRETGLPAYLERSGSGEGWHLWCFFGPPLKADTARTLARALMPEEVTLAGGEVVRTNTGRGVEVFPKQAKVEKKGYGNLVWLPWWSEAQDDANQFHQTGEDGELRPYGPIGFETVDAVRVDAAIAACLLPAGPPPEVADHSEDQSWREWRKRALAALPLESVYGEWLTGRKHSTGWLECRDPWSPSGDRDPSAGVSDGTGQGERGQFHSFISGKSLSVFDFLVARGLAADFAEARAHIARLSGIGAPAPRDAPSHAEEQPAPSLPEIVVNGRQFRHIVADAWSALLAANSPPSVFLRGGHLTWLRGDPAEGPSIESMDEPTVYAHLSRVADWMRVTQEGRYDAFPLHDVSRSMVVQPRQCLPVLTSLVHTPVYSHTGALLAEPGYHASDRLWLHPTVEVEAGTLPSHPTETQLAAARGLLLDDLFVDFPFKTEADRAHLIGALLLPFVRRLIDDQTPIHLVQAPGEGTGKGLVCQLISLVVTGTSGNSKTLPVNEDEVRKLLTAELALGRPIVLLDNAKRGRVLDSPALASVITTERWEDRLLGQSQILRTVNHALWLITGNNPLLSMELARRCVRIHMDAGMDRAWEREEFKHVPITGWAKEHRADLVRAVLTLVQAWLAAGRPPGPVVHRSFDAWANTVGGILQVAGISGFLQNLKDLYAASDAEGEMWREFVAQWWDDFGLQPRRPAELLAVCEEHDLLGKVRGDGSPRSQQTRLGTALQAAKDRVFGHLRIVQSPDPRGKGKLYSLAPVEHSSASGGAVPDGPATDLARAGSEARNPAICSLFTEGAEPAEPPFPPPTREGTTPTSGSTRAHVREGESKTGSAGTEGSADGPEGTQETPGSAGPQATGSAEVRHEAGDEIGQSASSLLDPGAITSLADLPDEWEEGV